MSDSPRIAELRRRLLHDPASIAFAQLAEEHRRAGEYDEAIRLCRAGLVQHPGYLSARVTLGRALIEVGDLDAAIGELNQVLCIAPDNLAATRALHAAALRRSASVVDGEPWYIATLDVFEPGSRNLPDPNADEARVENPSADRPHANLKDPTAADLHVSDSNANDPNDPNDPNDRILFQLESWLSAIIAARGRRGAAKRN